MPTGEDCRQRAESNRRLADTLLAAGDCNWALTLVFYAAVHQVNRLRCHDGTYSDLGTHTKTEQYLDGSHTAARSAYIALSGKSRRARYEVGYSVDQDAFDRAVKHYDRLTDYVERVCRGDVPGR